MEYTFNDILQMFKEAAEDHELKTLLDTVFSHSLTKTQKVEVETIIEVARLYYIWGLDWKGLLRRELKKFVNHHKLAVKEG